MSPHDEPGGWKTWQKPHRTWRDRFRDATRGIGEGMAGQVAFRVHLAAAVAVIAVAALVGVRPVGWGILILCIGLVLTAELFNSALEALANATTAEFDPRIRKTLDIASGAVLLAAIAAAITGCIVLGEAIFMAAGGISVESAR